MTGMDLVEFLNARLDEDEQSARAATGEAWNIVTIGPEDSPDDWVPIHLVVSGDDVAEARGDHGLAYAEHIARHDPARVLREVEAKRKILDEHERQEAESPVGGPKCCRCVKEMSGWQEDWSAQEYPCRTLRLLASAYAAHPDYRQEWAL